MKNKKPYIFVVGNEKGGVGKTTCSMHLIASLLNKNYTVLSIDADARQGSLSSYIANRAKYNINNADKAIAMPHHFHLECNSSKSCDELHKILDCKIPPNTDYIVCDTPGSYTATSRLLHSVADTIITPINDSFLDLEVIAKIDKNNFAKFQTSIYSQMVWQQKIEKLKKTGQTINWVVLRNRLNIIGSKNTVNIYKALEHVSKRLGFKVIPGFSERVIFRELFLEGITLVDIKNSTSKQKLNLSHIAARQELRNFLQAINISL